SHHPREAIELIRFLRRRDVFRIGATEHSALPKEMQLLALPSTFHVYPQFPKIRESGGRVVARPSIVAGTKYESVSRAYIAAVRSVLLGEKPARVAAAALEKELVEITGFAPGPPKNDVVRLSAKNPQAN